MNLSLAVPVFSAVCYLFAFGFYAHRLYDGDETSGRRAFALMRLGVLIATFSMAVSAMGDGFFLPIFNFSQAMSFFAWAVAFVYFVLLVKIHNESFGALISLILAVFAGLAVAASLGQKPEASPALMDEALNHPYFVIHIIGAYFAYASFTISFSAAVLYRLRHHQLKKKAAGPLYHRLSSLEDFEKLIYQPLLWGVPLLAMAVGVGFLWYQSVYGDFRSTDVKTWITSATVLLYFVIFYLRKMSLVRGKVLANLSVAAFGLVVFGFVGLRFIEHGHGLM